MNKVLFREVYVGLMLIDESGTTLRRKYMNITMLGTGNALVTECYNTCFILQEDNEYFSEVFLKIIKEQGFRF